MLIALTLMTAVLGGSFLIIENLKTVQVKIVRNADLDSQSQQLRRFIRAHISRYTRFEVNDIKDDDKACLTASQPRINARDGVYFAPPPSGLSADHPVIFHSGWTALNGNSDRSLSVFVSTDSPNSDISQLVGWGDNLTSGHLFSLILDNASPAFDFAGHTLSLSERPVVNDGHWHHIGFTYEGALNEAHSKLYLNGVSRTIDFPDNMNSLDTADNLDNGTGLVIAAAHDRMTAPFTGALSDIRLYDTALSEDDMSALAQGKEPKASSSLRLHYRLDSLGDNNSIEDETSYEEHADIQNRSALSLITSLSYITDYFRIGFYDSDGDGRYSLWQLESENEDCPETRPVLANMIVSDYFTKPDDGFFIPIPQSSSFELNTGLLDKTPTTGAGYGASAHRIRLSESSAENAFCNIAPHLRFDGSHPDCTTTTAYVQIVNDASRGLLPGSDHDRLSITGATATEQGTSTTYTDLPFDRDMNVTARYEPARGLLSYSSDEPGLNRRDWQQIFRSVRFHNDASQTSDDRHILFSIGAPGYEHDDGHMRYFRFQPSEGGSDISITDAMNEAVSDNMSLCGMTGYLATISSYDELAALGRLVDADNSSLRGWIGGSDNGTEGEWRWLDGPEAGIRFWSGDGDTGEPISDDNLSLTVSDRLVRDIGFNADNDSQLMVISTDNHTAMQRFHFWAATDTDFLYPDNSSDDEDYLVLSLDNASTGLWASATETQACLDSDMPMAVFSPCGYYIEWGGTSGNTQPVLSKMVTLDLSDYRQICPAEN